MSTGLAPAPVYRLPGVQLFASGVYRGQTWTPAAVDAAAENCRKLYALHIPPGVAQPVPEGGIGHDEAEDAIDWLERTDLPASGVVDPRTVRSIPDPDYPGHKILVGDLVNVPAETAERIRRGEYATGSAELYPDFLDDFGGSHGPALRRYCIMGGWVQQVKRLKRLPMPVPMAAPVQFGEPKATRAKPGQTILRYAERTVDRASLITALKAAMPGMSDATIEALTDDQLAEFVKNLPTSTPAPAPAATEPVAAMDDAATTPPAVAPTREEMIAALVAAGQDQALLEAMTPEELQAAYDTIVKAAAPVAEPPPVATMGERGRIKASVTPKTAVEKALAESRAALQALHRMSEQTLRETKAALIAPVRAKLIERGLTPAFVDAWIVPQLARLDNTQPVVKFAEGGVTKAGTAFAAKLAAAKQLDPAKCFIRFGEKLPGDATPAQDSKEAAVRKAEQHAATVPESVWEKTSFKSRAGFVAKFGEVFDAKGPAVALKMIG